MNYSSLARPTLTVIMPFYCVEKYIAEAISSVLNSSYRDLELLLIDDGSLDDSVIIADEFCRNDTRATVIRQENRGLGAARNTGFSYARGKFIHFMDSDDIVDSSFYTSAIESLELSGSDLLVAPSLRLAANDAIDVGTSLDEVFKNSRSGITIHDYPELLRYQSAWGRIYNREFAHKIDLKYPEGIWFEDQQPAVESYLLAKSIDILNSPGILYRVVASSITGNRVEVRYIQELSSALHSAFSTVYELGSSEIVNLWLRMQIGQVITLLRIKQNISNVDYITIAIHLLHFLDQQLSPSEKLKLSTTIRIFLYLIRTATITQVQSYLANGVLDPNKFVLDYHSDNMKPLFSWPGVTDCIPPSMLVPKNYEIPVQVSYSEITSTDQADELTLNVACSLSLGRDSIKHARWILKLTPTKGGREILLNTSVLRLNMNEENRVQSDWVISAILGQNFISYVNSTNWTNGEYYIALEITIGKLTIARKVSFDHDLHVETFEVGNSVGISVHDDGSSTALLKISKHIIHPYFC